jgi:hypothetical protein
MKNCDIHNLIGQGTQRYIKENAFPLYHGTVKAYSLCLTTGYGFADVPIPYDDDEFKCPSDKHIAIKWTKTGRMSCNFNEDELALEEAVPQVYQRIRDIIVMSHFVSLDFLFTGHCRWPSHISLRLLRQVF